MSINIVDIFLFIYESRRMKPAEIVLRRGAWGKEIRMEEVNLTKIKIYCKSYVNITM
jgi:hypothetical protein